MMARTVCSNANRGFTLLETLIAFMVLSFGLLGAVALQAKAKQASFDSMQRAAAVALAGDIMQRIRSNDTLNLDTQYQQVFSSTATINGNNGCFSNTCTNAEIAAMDLEQWVMAIQAKENTGSLDDTTVCISTTPVANTQGRGFNVTVSVAWAGRQAFVMNAANQAINCGENNDYRRVVSINSYLLVRD
ncbi:type IV pilus modification protein PilV [Pseudoalteromonas sp. R3]|jgi:type IV pilus assembly protein PilV|uniref:type IV pilus modification protein PilV n=1 Tax=Pseudoalteromonas sp. R3 TaxID=1709477 RepID=UPI0006B64EA2|nr:type IV pilus modification protein PilV [Pseudoalteromonas sp. R3]AZZ97634.1 type IV pilus modification protein PilV [Pseudoalteromonas sp. R3]